jgi:hypothetical protein
MEISMLDLTREIRIFNNINLIIHLPYFSLVALTIDFFPTAGLHSIQLCLRKTSSLLLPIFRRLWSIHGAKNLATMTTAIVPSNNGIPIATTTHQ